MTSTESAILKPDEKHHPGHGPVLAMIDVLAGTNRLVDPGRPQLRISDLAAIRGDGVFETMLARRGVPRKVEAHLSRLAASARMAELDIPARAVWHDTITNALRAHGLCEEALVKLAVSRGVEGGDRVTAWVHVSDCTGHYDTQRTRGIDVLLLDRGYDSGLGIRAPWLLIGAKTLSYAVNMAALRHARSNGADDAIFVSSDGIVLEGPTSTLLLAMHVDDPARRTLVTPSLDSGVLAGTTQAAVYPLARAAGWRAHHAELHVEDLFEADAAWLVSSGRLLAPINRIDGRVLKRRPSLDAELSGWIHQIE